MRKIWVGATKMQEQRDAMDANLVRLRVFRELVAEETRWKLGMGPRAGTLWSGCLWWSRDHGMVVLKLSLGFYTCFPWFSSFLQCTRVLFYERSTVSNFGFVADSFQRRTLDLGVEIIDRLQSWHCPRVYIDSQQYMGILWTMCSRIVA